MVEPVVPVHEGMTYHSLRDRFRWRLPERFNIGVAASDDQDPSRPALRSIDSEGTRRMTTYGELSEASSRFAAGLAERGVGRGDRVGIVLPQRLETGVTHLALWKLGAISLPMASLFGPDALAFRIEDAGARLVVTDRTNLAKVAEAAGAAEIVTVEDDYEDLLGSEPLPAPVATAAEDPAYLIYTSGTTGPPKGALHAHRSLFGHLPGFELYYDFPPRSDDLIWTPADWAWIGGLMDVLIPSWCFGMEVLTVDHDFDPSWAVELMVEEGVSLAFLPPTALKMMRAAGVKSSSLRLRAIFTGGEPLGEEVLHWAETSLGAVINEGYGQTECNLVVGNCRSVWPVRPGSMGRALPGHEVAVMDEEGRRVVGEEGEIAVRAPDPVMMLGYWNRPDATAGKYRDGWLLTGDEGIEDEDGYLWFKSRKDDLIMSMGYRIGPGEIEESLMRHPAVAMCAVVGAPDEVRGEVPAAFVVLRDGYEGHHELFEDLQHHVRTRLAAHEVPRRIDFVSDLPRTTTGKVMRRVLRDRLSNLP